MRGTRCIAALAALALALVAGGCGSDDNSTGSTSYTPAPSSKGTGAITRNPDNAKVALTIGSKNFTEQKVLGQVYAQGLTAAGYKVKTDLNLGDEQTALKALKAGEVDAYPEYTGTALLSFFGKTADELPEGSRAGLRGGQAGLRQAGHRRAPANAVHLLQRGGGDQADGRQARTVKNISDLAGKAQELTLYGSPECRRRLDCLLGLEQVYGLKFKKFTPVAIEQRHEVLTSGRADVSIVFTTDPQIKRNGEVLLEDDKGMFPPYNSTLVMTQGRRRQGRTGPREDRRADPQAADGRRTCRSSTRAWTSTRRSPRRSPRSTSARPAW